MDSKCTRAVLGSHMNSPYVCYIFQIDLIGQSVYEFTHPCDHDEIQGLLTPHHPEQAVKEPATIFIRMKCTLTSKGKNINLKSATYKVSVCSE